MSCLTVEDLQTVKRPMFIETGTNYGETLANATQIFEFSKSIEYNPELFEACLKRFAGVSNVSIHLGHSPQILPSIIDAAIPTTFWLDAHYFGNRDSITPYGECPLAKELEIIASRPWAVKPIVIIDDAHMFDDSIPHPGSKYPFWKSNESGWDMYKRREWPRVEEMDEIMKGYRRSLFSEFIIRYDGE